MGPCDETRRELSHGGRWPGLSFDDNDLLHRYLDGLDVLPNELHTHIPLGSLPELVGGLDTQRNRKQVQSSWARRADAALLFGGKWTLIECKPEADHHALGQILCYRFWWERERHLGRISKCIVVTDVCDADVKVAFSSFGVRVHECGPVLPFRKRTLGEVSVAAAAEELPPV